MISQKTPGPIPVAKSRRVDNWRGLTSINPGELAPVAYFPVLREDSFSGRITLQVRSDETLKVVLNPVKVRAYAYLVPKTAQERFGGSMDILNRSYAGEANIPGVGPCPDFFQNWLIAPEDETNGIPILDTLGVHYVGHRHLNSDLLESYNLIVNHMRKKVSSSLPLREKTDETLARGFWDHSVFQHIKPSFDAGLMEGEVPIEFSQRQIPIQNLWTDSVNATGSAGETQELNVDGTFTPTVGDHLYRQYRAVMATTDTAAPPYGDLALSGATISLANIEAAKQSQVFAAMRDRYKGVPDEFLVDLLMKGIRIPDEAYKEPILLGMTETVLGQNERYATDGANLDTSVSNMSSLIDLSVAMPAVNPGGMILVLLQIVPEQLFERGIDPALKFYGAGVDVSNIPDYLADYLDPQKVEVVPNEEVDVRHTLRDEVFGYAPLNYRWQRSNAMVGGRFKRPNDDAFSEDRQRIWSAEQTDPTLGESFYLCPSPFPKTVFQTALPDPYEVFTVGRLMLTGNTVFGGLFDEDLGSYDAVITSVDTGRIDQLDSIARDVEILPVVESEAENVED